MVWFLERISAKSPELTFGIKERTLHSADFHKLVKTGALKQIHNLEMVDCALCDERHETPVRNHKGRLYYVCENGCGRKELTDEEVAIFEYDNVAFLRLLSQDLGVRTDTNSFEDASAYTPDTFYRLGIYKDKKVEAEVYYLRTTAPHEPSEYFEHMGNAPKVLITNIAKPTLVYGREGTFYCILADVLSADTARTVFDGAKFATCIEGIRQVRFDKTSGNLYLDGRRIYTAPEKSEQFYFLLCLWEKWEQQVPHADIHHFITKRTKKNKSDDAQKFCHKTISAIRKKCKKIDTVISIPTTGRYMMADPT